MNGNIIGEPLETYVISQINARQKLHGSGATKVRTTNEVNLLNASTTWIKLASSVKVTDSKRLTEIGVSSSLTGHKLAKKFILNSGISSLEGGSLKNRGGFDPTSPGLNSSYTYGQYGYVPMPGIISADIKALNRGSIKKAQLKFKANDTQQFQIIDLLYLRLGYTVLLEWGNSIYTTNGENKRFIRNTVIEDQFYKKDDFTEILKDIEKTRSVHQGNYDGFLAKISNFSWSINSDGSYDITLTLISLGDVVESLKTNLSPDLTTTKFIKHSKTSLGALANSSNDQEEETTVEVNQANSMIHAMLYVWKWIDEVNGGKPMKNTTSWPSYYTYYTVDGTGKEIGYNMGNAPEDTNLIDEDGNIIVGTTKYIFVFRATKTVVFRTTTADSIGKFKIDIDGNGNGDGFRGKTMSNFIRSGTDVRFNNAQLQDISVPGGSTTLTTNLYFWDLRQPLNASPSWFTDGNRGWAYFFNAAYEVNFFDYAEVDITTIDNNDNRLRELHSQASHEWATNGPGKKYFDPDNNQFLKKFQSDGTVNGKVGNFFISASGDNGVVINERITIKFQSPENSGQQNLHLYGATIPGSTPGNPTIKKPNTYKYQTNEAGWPLRNANIVIPDVEQKGTEEKGGDSKYAAAFLYAGMSTFDSKFPAGKKQFNQGEEFYIQPAADTSGNTKVKLENPLKNASPGDAIKIKTKIPEHYLRFGFLLKYVKEKIIPKIKSSSSKHPIFDLNFDDNNIMFSPENHISLDPRVAIIRNDNFLGEKVFNGDCKIFRVADAVAAGFDPLGTTLVDKTFAGLMMNVYLNFNFIIDSLNPDVRGDINLFDFIQNLCDGINRALGGINNIEPIIDEDSNVCRIVDTTPLPGTIREDDNDPRHKEYTLQLIGYNNSGGKYISNFIRKLDLKTAITPEFATMVTVGATAGGYTKGTDATAFSKWNQGLVDPYKEEVEPGNEETAKAAKSGSVDEAIQNWEERFVNASEIANRIGISFIEEDGKVTTDKEFKDSIIQGNSSIGTEYYKYYMAKDTNADGGGGGSVGFIPFKLGFTMDGLSGIKIYNKINVNTKFLPPAYGNDLDLIITGVDNKINNQNWETRIQTTVIPKATPTASPRVFRGSGAVSSGNTANASIGNVSGLVLTNYPPNLKNKPSGCAIPTSYTITTTITGNRKKNIDKMIKGLKGAGITNPFFIVGVLTTVGKESNYKPVEEKTTWTKKNLMDLFKACKNDPSLAEALSKKSKIYKANWVYMGKNNGYPGGPYTINSGNKKPSSMGGTSNSNFDASKGDDPNQDGYKYRGRGFNQLTNRGTYEDYGDLIGKDLLNNPDLVLNADTAAQILGLFYTRAVKKSTTDGQGWKNLGYSSALDFINNGICSIDEGIAVSIRATAGYGYTWAREHTQKAYSNAQKQKSKFTIT